MYTCFLLLKRSIIVTLNTQCLRSLTKPYENLVYTTRIAACECCNIKITKLYC